MEEYNLKPLIQNGRALAEFRTFIYSLPQVGHFSYIKLVKHLAGDCYLPTGNTPGFFSPRTTNNFQSCRRQLWRQFFWKTKFRPYNQYIKKTLQRHY